MPIYEYQCKACGHQLEVIQKISDKRLRKCPSCSKQSLSKLVSAAGFRLKGGGWYETDFKSGKKKNVAAGDGGDSGASSKSSDTGADKKSDAKKSGGDKSSGNKSSGNKAAKADKKAG